MKRLLFRAYARQRLISWNRDMAQRRADAVAAAAIEGAEKLTCNARDLHAFLGVGRDFSTWFKERIAKYGFIEGVDFITLPNSGEQDSGVFANSGENSEDRPRIDYALSLDMAKELMK